MPLKLLMAKGFGFVQQALTNTLNEARASLSNSGFYSCILQALKILVHRWSVICGLVTQILKSPFDTLLGLLTKISKSLFPTYLTLAVSTPK